MKPKSRAVQVEDELWFKAKSKAALNGMSIVSVIRLLLKFWVEDEINITIGKVK